MRESDLEKYMRNAMRLALATVDDYWSVDLDDSVPMMKDIMEAKAGLHHMTRRLADTRVALAVMEVVKGHPAPPQYNLERDGLNAVEVDMIAERMVQERKAQRRNDEGKPDWGPAVLKHFTAMADEELAAAPAVTRAATPPPTLSVQYDGARTLQVGGQEVRLPIPIWRGTHEPGQCYETHDLVTRGGSMWICTSATDETPGAGATSWQLVVKRGRDGRDRDEKGGTVSRG